MKQIEKIFIDLDDEITFVVERIRNSDKSRVLLVVPDRAALISSIVSLKIVLRHCIKSNKALALVTSDELGYSLSQKAGIVTVMKVSQIDDSIWDKAYAVLEKKKEELKKKLESSSIESKHAANNILPKKDTDTIDAVNNKDNTSVDGDVSDKDKVKEIENDQLASVDEELNENSGKTQKGQTGAVEASSEKNETIEKVDQITNVTGREDDKDLGIQKKIVKDVITGDVIKKSIDGTSNKTDQTNKEEDKKKDKAFTQQTPIKRENELEVSKINGFEFVAGGDIAKIKKKINPTGISKKPASSISASSIGTTNSIRKTPTSGAGKKDSMLKSSREDFPVGHLNGSKGTSISSSSKDTIKSEDKKQSTSSVQKSSVKIKEPMVSDSNTHRRPKGIVGRDITGMKFKRNPIKSPKKAGYKPKYIKHPSAKTGKSRKGLPINISKKYLVIGVGIFLMVLVYAYSFAPSATLRVDVETKPISVSKDIKAIPKLDKIDLEKLNIPASSIEVKVTGSKTGKATGKKKTGEVAKGEVTLFNKTGKEMSLPAGINVVAGNRKFTTDVSVIIPEKTIVKTIDGDTTIFGSVDVNVTAVSFGEEYNLSEGTEFSVEGYGSNEIVGKTFKNFSGGTTTEYIVVSQEDVDKLKGQIIKELKPQAIEEVKKKIGEDNFFLENDIEFKVDEVASSPKIGEKADSFDLSVIATAKVTSFSNKDLDELASSLTESLVSEGYSLNQDSVKMDSKILKRDGDSLTVNLKINALTTRNISKEDILNNLTGKGYSEAEEFLRNDDSISDYSLVLEPSWLFGPFKHMPSSPAKIDLTLNYVSSQGEG